jgi:benzodiazapine receptor
MTNTNPLKSFLVVLAFLIGTLFVGAIGGMATAPAIPTWYAELERPFFAPPNYVFGPVWTLLYIMIGFAGWRVWRTVPSAARSTALIFWAAQLLLNLIWSFVFFKFQLIGAALIEIQVLLLSIIATILRFRDVDRMASWLLAPYFAWVSFAAVLNFGFWWLNRGV